MLVVCFTSHGVLKLGCEVLSEKQHPHFTPGKNVLQLSEAFPKICSPVPLAPLEQVRNVCASFIGFMCWCVGCGASCDSSSEGARPGVIHRLCRRFQESDDVEAQLMRRGIRLDRDRRVWFGARGWSRLPHDTAADTGGGPTGTANLKENASRICSLRFPAFFYPKRNRERAPKRSVHPLC